MNEIYNCWDSLTPEQQTWARVKLPAQALSVLNSIIDMHDRGVDPVSEAIHYAQLTANEMMGVLQLAEHFTLTYDINRETWVKEITQ